VVGSPDARDIEEMMMGKKTVGKKTVAAAVYETTEPTGDLFVKRPGEVPCRNPSRIPHMINLLHIIWAQEGNTDMRMGQLLMNAARLGGWASPYDIWNCEDEIFAQGFLKMLQIDVKAAKG
jgi:hypothetical protein